MREIQITHRFASAKPDSSDLTLIQPSNWNDSHVVGNSIPHELAQTGTNIAVDTSVSTSFKAVLSGNHFLENPTHLVEGDTLLFIFTQDSTGKRLLTFDTLYKVSGSSSLSTKAGSIDVLSCYYNGASLLCTLQRNFTTPISYSAGTMDFSVIQGSGLITLIQ